MFTGILLKTLSTLAFTAMSIGVRAAAPTCPVAEIVFFRSAFALVVLGIWLGANGGFPGHLATRRPLGHLGRGLSGSAGMFANFLSLSKSSSLKFGITIALCARRQRMISSGLAVRSFL